MKGTALLFRGLLSPDPFAGFFKLIVPACTLFVFLCAYESCEIKGDVFLSVQDTSPALKLTILCAALFTFAGIGYKIAVVPFHMWSPDVYQGAPTPFTAVLSLKSLLSGHHARHRLSMSG